MTIKTGWEFYTLQSWSRDVLRPFSKSCFDLEAHSLDLGPERLSHETKPALKASILVVRISDYVRRLLIQRRAKR